MSPEKQIAALSTKFWTAKERRDQNNSRLADLKVGGYKVCGRIVLQAEGVARTVEVKTGTCQHVNTSARQHVNI